MTRLRLSPSASAVPTDAGLVLRSDLSTFRLEGPDLAAAVNELLPLLDGTRDLAAITSALPRYSPESVGRLIDALRGHGVIEAVSERVVSPQEVFLREWTGEPAEAMSRLGSGGVLLAGLEPWAVTAARDLAAAGVGRIVLLDDLPRAEAVRDAITRELPAIRITAGAIDGIERMRLDQEEWGVLAVTLPNDELLLGRRLADFAQRANLVSLSAHLDGLEAVLGPVVVPGRTACWNCVRVRRLAASPLREDERSLQEALLRERPPRRERALLGPMADVLGHLLALEIVKLISRYTESALIGRMLIQNLVTLENTFHTVVRLPWCEVCGGPELGGAGAGGPTLHDAGPSAGVLDRLDDPKQLRAALSGLVDHRVGIVRHLIVSEASAGEPELPIAATAVLSSLPGSSADRDYGSGKGLRTVDAMLGAVGEALERYSASIYGPSAILRSSLDELGGSALDPRWLSLYTPEQYASGGFPFSPFAPDLTIDWTRGRWCDTDEPVWVPALPTYFNYHAAPAERFCQVTSNGLAAGAALADAALRATLELVERDAFMITWLCRLPARRIQHDDGLDPGSREVVRQLAVCGCEARLYLLDAGAGIPAVACVGLGDGRTWPGATVSMAAHLNPDIAVRKAILEQGHAGSYIRRLMLDGTSTVPKSAEAVRSLVDHALYYVPVERRGAFDFLLDESLPPIDLAELPAPADVSLRECVGRLDAAGIRAAVIDVTSPDLVDSPFRVARALATHTQPIHFGHGLAPLANPRLAARMTGSVNPDPHPVA